jgi:membrane protease subunit (stomatin/prohibitin family)
MGLISAALSSAGGVLSDAWKDYFVCELDRNELMKKISKRKGGSNKGSDYVITHGSKVSVPAGIAMVIVDGGQVVEFTADPGEFVYSSSEPPTFFDSGGLFKGIKNLWSEGAARFAFGGQAPKNMAVFAVNIKEVMGNKFGTPQPVPYEDPQYRNINIRYNGTYSFRIADVMTFIEVLAGTETRSAYRVEDFTEGMREMFITYLNQEINTLNLPYTRLTSAGVEITKKMTEALKADWQEAYGILVTKVGINAPTLDEKSQARVERFGDALFFSDADSARGHIAGAAGDALRVAAKNSGGSMVGFAGMNMANQAAGGIFNQFQTAPQTPQQAQQSAAAWKCECGEINSGKFCQNCGKAKPSDEWKCQKCGAVNKGKFCSECGASRS